MKFERNIPASDGIHDVIKFNEYRSAEYWIAFWARRMRRALWIARTENKGQSNPKSVLCAGQRKGEMAMSELKADYKEACDRLQTTNLIKDEQATREWLKKYAPDIANAPILYREDGDTRHDTIVKPELLEAFMRENHKSQPLAIFEDRNSMVAKWREMSYTVFQPADGDI